jgi:CheY-like chemotaxis protein
METQPIEILLVEDNEDDVLILSEALEGAERITVARAVTDGEQALEYLRGEGRFADAPLPGLILLDINMPRKNGLLALEEIKADPALRHIPVVMMTASDQESDIVRSYASGASSYLRKPVGLEQLVELVRGFELYWTLVSTVPKPTR